MAHASQLDAHNEQFGRQSRFNTSHALSVLAVFAKGTRIANYL